MNSLPASSYETPATKPVLQSVIDKLISPLLPVAVRNNSFIVNDVPSFLRFGNDEKEVACVINGILRSVIHNARESCIRVSAQLMYGKLMVVSVKDSNSFNTYGVACSLQDVLPLAQKMGGQLDITNQRQKVTTIVFKFPVEEANQHSLKPAG